MIYLDNSATTRVRPEVFAAMSPYLTDHFGNPSSIHGAGRQAREAIDEARVHVARLLNCQTNEIYFSGCGTLSNNVALLGRARFVEANGHKRHLIVSKIEHPSVLGPAQYLESQGFEVTYLDVDKSGLVNLDALEKALQRGASMVSIMWANNEIGVVEPLAEICAMIKSQEKESGKDIFFHCDGVQVIGKIPVDMSQLPLSSLAFSGHKFGAPKGIGALFVRRLVNIMPIIYGGGQEMGLMPGTEPLANIVALGEAARLAHLEQAELAAKLRSFQEKLFAILSGVPGLEITGPQDINKRLPGHVSVAMSDIEGEGLVLKCDLKGLALSSGSACHQGIIEPSSVLKAIALPQDLALGALRITFGRDNTMDDVDKVGKVLIDLCAKARAKALK